MKHQKGKSPTAHEMKQFAERYSTAQWSKLCLNEFFLKYYGEDLNMLAIAAEMILNDKPVNKLSDVRIKNKKPVYDEIDSGFDEGDIPPF